MPSKLDDLGDSAIDELAKGMQDLK